MAPLSNGPLCPSNKRAKLAEQGGVCAYCGCALSVERAEGVARATWDHIIPRSKGGTHDPDNLCLACEPCNAAKGSHLIKPRLRANSV